MIHHRSEEFGAILTQVRKDLTWLCGCDGEAVLLAASGTGGMEATVTSLFSQGDRVVVVSGGKFGERFGELAAHYGLKADTVCVEPGRAVSVDAVMSAVTARTRGILIQACESSTGAYHPVGEIGAALSNRDDVLLCVDAIMALGIQDLDMKRDRIDVLIGASQKALMCPPGLAVVALNRRALSRVLKPGQGYYFSLAREVGAQTKGQTGFTPAISHIRALNAALSMIRKEGKPGLFARHKELQNMARKAFREMGLELFNRDEEAAIGITVVRASADMDVGLWRKQLREKEGLWLAGGQGALEGKVFRLGHFGACQPADLAWALEKIRENLP
jgi:aspartate aminotransferase-like enzyme